MDLKIKDHPHLINRNGVIINTDTKSLRNYFIKKSYEDKKTEEILNLKKEIEDLKLLVQKLIKPG